MPLNKLAVGAAAGFTVLALAGGSWAIEAHTHPAGAIASSGPIPTSTSASTANLSPSPTSSPSPTASPSPTPTPTLTPAEERTPEQAATETAAADATTTVAAPAPTAAQPSTQAPKPQSFGLAAMVAQSPTAGDTDQILGVVGSGSSADVHLFEKQPDGTWQDVLDTSGHVGSQGVGAASESSTATPKGSWPLTMAFGIDPNPGSQLSYRQVDADSCYISDITDPQYNTWQERENCASPNERMIDESVAYRYGMVIGYNQARTPGAGSAFFVHVDDGEPTVGCVSVPQPVMVALLERIHSGARIVNVNSESELADY